MLVVVYQWAEDAHVYVNGLPTAITLTNKLDRAGIEPKTSRSKNRLHTTTLTGPHDK